MASSKQTIIALKRSKTHLNWHLIWYQFWDNWIHFDQEAALISQRKDKAVVSWRCRSYQQSTSLLLSIILMCCVAVLIQPNNIWTCSSDGSTTVLAEAQLTPGKKNNARKWMQQLTDLTFMYQRMRRSIKSTPRAYLGLPCHSGATGFWQPVYCLLSCMSAWLCHPPWQAWWILWFLVVLELLYFQTNCLK